MKNVKETAFSNCDTTKAKERVYDADVIVEKDNSGRLCYSIKYNSLSDNETHIGYSSYNPNYVFEWLNEDIEVVNKKERRIKPFKQRSLRQKVVTVITIIVLIVYIISALAIDSKSNIPSIACIICMIYLSVFTYANRSWLCYHFE